MCQRGHWSQLELDILYINVHGVALFECRKMKTKKNSWIHFISGRSIFKCLCCILCVPVMVGGRPTQWKYINKTHRRCPADLFFILRNVPCLLKIYWCQIFPSINVSCELYFLKRFYINYSFCCTQSCIDEWSFYCSQVIEIIKLCWRKNIGSVAIYTILYYIEYT